jgi:hypothetical protein
MREPHVECPPGRKSMEKEGAGYRGDFVIRRLQGRRASPMVRAASAVTGRMAMVRTGGRVVEGTALEMRRTGNRTESSNLSLSAKHPQHFSLITG